MLHIDNTTNRRFGIGVHCAGGLVVLVAIAATYVLLYAPTMRATDDSHVDISEIQHSLRRAPAIHREYTQLSGKLQRMEQRLARIRRRVPRQAEESAFLEALAGAAEQAGIVIRNITPGPKRSMTGYSQMELSIAGSASFESVCRFVDQIRTFPRLAKVEGLEVRADASGAGVYPVNITVAIFYDLAAHPNSEG